MNDLFDYVYVLIILCYRKCLPDYVGIDLVEVRNQSFVIHDEKCTEQITFGFHLQIMRTDSDLIQRQYKF